MLRTTLVTFTLALLLAALLGAQAAVSPALTDADRIDVALVNVMAQLAAAKRELSTCTGKLDALSVADQLAKTRTAIEGRHPGFVWEASTGTLTAREGSQ